MKRTAAFISIRTFAPPTSACSSTKTTTTPLSSSVRSPRLLRPSPVLRRDVSSTPEPPGLRPSSISTSPLRCPEIASALCTGRLSNPVSFLPLQTMGPPIPSCRRPFAMRIKPVSVSIWETVAPFSRILSAFCTLVSVELIVSFVLSLFNGTDVSGVLLSIGREALSPAGSVLFCP